MREGTLEKKSQVKKEEVRSERKPKKETVY